jgi:hypothetical protein
MRSSLIGIIPQSAPSIDRRPFVPDFGGGKNMTKTTMRPQTTISRLTATALAFLVLPIAAARATDEDGFAGMWNGNDLGGWRTTGNWVVEEGNGKISPPPARAG